MKANKLGYDFHIEQPLFEKITKQLKPDMDSSVDCPALKAELNGWHVDVHAWHDTNYELRVGDFGLYSKHGFEVYIPTLEQRAQLQEAINKEAERQAEIMLQREREDTQAEVDRFHWMETKNSLNDWLAKGGVGL